MGSFLFLYDPEQLGIDMRFDSISVKSADKSNMAG